MDKLIIPDLTLLKVWLEQLNIFYYECDTCDSLHLSTEQSIDIDDLVNTKLDIINNTIICAASTIIRPSMMMSLMFDLNQINASTLSTKLFIDIQDDNFPRLVICQTMSIARGLTRSQFHGFLMEFEEQLTQIIIDINVNHLILSEENEDQDEITGSLVNQPPHQLH